MFIRRTLDGKLKISYSATRGLFNSQKRRVEHKPTHVVTRIDSLYRITDDVFYLLFMQDSRDLVGQGEEKVCVLRKDSFIQFTVRGPAV